MIDKAIGARIRQQRELLGYTREQLAEMLDVTPKFCADIELGAKGMSIETLCRLSDILMLTTDYILFGKTDLSIDQESLDLLNLCPKSKLAYLKSIIRNFLKACK